MFIRSRTHLLLGLVSSGLGTACAESLKSPDPSLLATNPGLVCPEQLTTTISVTGAGLSPAPVETMTDAASTELPVLWLEHVVQADGTTGGGAVVDLPEIEWAGQSAVSFVTSPASSLPVGTFDLWAKVADGRQTRLPNALTVVPAPVFAASGPALACVDQATQQVRLSGTDFLTVGGVFPTVTVGDVAVTVTNAGGCESLAGPIAAERCATLDISLATGSVPSALHDVSVTNPAPASCASLDVLEVEVVDAPSLDTASPSLVCGAQADVVLELRGTGFVTLEDGTLPTVMVGGTPWTPSEARDCAPLSGPEGGAVCETLELQIPAGAAPTGRAWVTVANPAPADCETPSAVEISFLPPPRLDIVLPEPQCTTQGDATWTLSGDGFLVLADGTMPTITIDGLEWPAGEAAVCQDIQSPAGGQLCRTLRVTTPDGALSSGVLDVSVTNPGEASCTTESEMVVELVPPPTLDSVDHALACDAQDADTLVLTGTGFLVTRTGVLPSVTIGGVRLPADSADNCVQRTGPSQGSTCTTLVVTVPQNAVGAGVHAVTVTNPEDADCSSTEAVEMEFIGPPSVSLLESPLVCDAESDLLHRVIGTGFLVLDDGTLPSVHFGAQSGSVVSADNCAPLAGPAGGQLCTDLWVSTAQAALGAGVFDVQVRNPETAACTSDSATTLTVVGEPVVVSTDPAMDCIEGSSSTITLTGQGFLQASDGSLPTVRVGTWEGSAATVDGCSLVATVAGAALCTELTVDVPFGTWSDDVYAIQVDNPAPASCDSAVSVDLTLVGPPVVTSLEGALACDEQFDVPLRVVGEGFVRAADGALPTVWVAGTALAPTSGDGCAALTGQAGGERCTSLDVVLPAGTLTAGVHAVWVENPAPAICDSVDSLALELVAPPSVVSADTALVCNTQDDVTLTISGADFLVLADGTLPTVTVEGATWPAESASVCVSLLGPDGGTTCAELTVVLPMGALPDGVHDLRVTNPDPAACETAVSTPIEVVRAPSVADTNPAFVCGGLFAETIDLSGTGFLVLADGTEPTVKVGSQTYPIDSLTGCTSLTGPEGGQVCTDLSFTYSASSLPVGTYDLTVENPGTGACTNLEATVFSVAAPPTLSSIDPEVTCPTGGTIFVLGSGFTADTLVTIGTVAATATDFIDENTLEVTVPAGLTPGLDYDVTVSTTGCGTDTLVGALHISGVPSVFFVDPSVTYTGIQIEGTAYISSVNSVSEAWIEEATTGIVTSIDFSHTTGATQVGMTFPEGLREGFYTVGIANDYGCTAELSHAFYAEDDLTVTLTEVDPSLGWTGTETAVVVTGAGFDDVPRLYLNPSTGSSAAGLTSVRYRGSDMLNAVIPSGLDVDVYDLIVINPDGGIGLLTGAFEVSTLPTPKVDAVAPASVSTSDGSIAITGEDFRSPAVHIECVDANTGAESTASAVVSSWTSTTITGSIPSASYSNGDVCVVVVTNDDGTYTEYSAISITSPSYNLYGFVNGGNLTTSRRAPAVFAGRATDVERYIYAIGGDAGNPTNAMSSVEVVPLDKYGGLGTWSRLPLCELPQATTLAGAVNIGRFIYLVGGNHGTGPSATVYRAQVLDPRETPRFDTLEMDYGDGVNGLTTGTWIYRIAALYPSTWDSNPAGESLASDPIVINVPDVPDLIELTVHWTAVDGASGYRVYRTPAAGSGSNTEEWLADVSGGSVLSYTDTGTSTSGTRLPLEDGSIGAWKQLPSLTKARQAPGVAVGTDPSDPNQRYIYVAGGLSTGSVSQVDIEYIGIYEDSDQIQSFDSSWTISANVLDTTRYELGGWTVEAGLNPSVPVGESWIYFGGGQPTGNATKGTQAGLVSAGGELTFWTVTDSMNKARAGFGGAVASDQLYAFGGHNGAPSVSSDSTSVDSAGPPTLSGWNAGPNMLEARYLLGVTQESAHIYVVGGQNTTGKPTSTVEYTPW